MPAKFVNLIEFFELKIVAEVEVIRFIAWNRNGDGIVLSLNVVDVRPNEKPALGQGRNGDARMVKGYIFVGHHSFFAPEKVGVGGAHEGMSGSGYPFPVNTGSKTDTQEKDDLYQAEEQIHRRQVGRNIFSSHYQNKNIYRHKQQTRQVQRTAMRLI
jgi:hypothetical protein